MPNAPATTSSEMDEVQHYRRGGRPNTPARIGQAAVAGARSVCATALSLQQLAVVQPDSCAFEEDQAHCGGVDALPLFGRSGRAPRESRMLRYAWPTPRTAGCLQPSVIRFYMAASGPRTYF
jgi:hypothetical protein